MIDELEKNIKQSESILKQDDARLDSCIARMDDANQALVKISELDIAEDIADTHNRAIVKCIVELRKEIGNLIKTISMRKVALGMGKKALQELKKKELENTTKEN